MHRTIPTRSLRTCLQIEVFCSTGERWLTTKDPVSPPLQVEQTSIREDPYFSPSSRPPAYTPYSPPHHTSPPTL